MSAYVSVFDRLSQTETRSSAMKKPAFQADFRSNLNTSANSISSGRSTTSRNTTRTSSSRMTTRTAPVSSSLFNRLASTDTYASAQMKGKIEVEPQVRSSGKTTNSFFARMASADTYASADMKGRRGNLKKGSQAKETANDDFFNRTATEETKGSEKKLSKQKSNRKTSNAFFSRLAVSDTYASATMKGKIEPSSNNEASPSPRKPKARTNSSFFDRLSRTETSSSRRRKMCYGDEVQEGDTEIRWDNSRRPSSAKSVSSAKSTRSRLSLRSTKSTGVLLRNKLFRRSKPSAPVDSTASRSNLINQKSPRHKAEITISKSAYNMKSSGGSVKSSSSVKSKTSVKSSRSTKSRSSLTSRTSAISRTSATTTSTKKTQESRLSPSRKSYNSPRNLSSTATSPRQAAPRQEAAPQQVAPRQAAPRQAAPRQVAPPLQFDSDEDMSFGSDEEDDILNTETTTPTPTPTPKETDSSKENMESTAPVQDLVMTGSEEHANPSDSSLTSQIEDLTLPNQSASEPSSEERAAPQDKPVVIDETMLSFDESFDKEEDTDLDNLLGPIGNGSADSLQSESPVDEFSLEDEEETPPLEEEQKISEDPSVDASGKMSKFKLLLTDKYHPEKGLQELDVGALNLVDSLVGFESNDFTNEQLSVLIIEALFKRDFKDGDHWEVDPGTARELEDDEMDDRDLDGRAFVVKQQARWDSDQHYSVAAAKGTVTIWPETDEIRMENYSYFVAG